MRFIDSLSFPMLIILAIMMSIVPFGAEPHLIEKLNMLFSGTLSKPIDIFDLLMHSSPFILFAIKSIRILNGSNKRSGTDVIEKTDKTEN